jgi:glycosyltransferase involved in cell wall biosynthesis
MKVVVYPSDLGGCGYYRLIWPAKVLQKMGHDVTIVHPKNVNKISGNTDETGKLVGVNIPKGADVMVFQRVTSKNIIDAIGIMRDNGIAVVLDVDDDMSTIHPSNPAWAALHPKNEATLEYSWNHAAKSYDLASHVTVSSTALLKKYASHGRGTILHNFVPQIMTEIPHIEQVNTIGWGGSMHSHPDDPQVVGNAMARIVREGYRFQIVGPPWGTKRAFGLDDEPLSTGPVPIENYCHTLGRLAVGVAPLNDTKFNAAKSWLKMLEYAAVGVPCIGSPRPEYVRLNKMGIGLLAQTPRDWYRNARRLLDDFNYRMDMSQRGRDIVREHLTIEANAHKWWEAWSAALAIERGPLGQRSIQSAVGTVSD